VFKNKNITVIGFGIEGTALAIYLASKGALVTISDAKSEGSLTDNIQKVQGLSVRLSLGANRVDDVIGADMVFVSQGVPLDIPAVTAARERGIPMNSLTNLFMETCPGTVVGITGSAGKSTATALMGEVLKASGKQTFVGGNIGTPLLGYLDEMNRESWVSLEISHTQLEIIEKSPHVATVTNIAPSHADRYPNLDDYISLKKKIFRFQTGEDFLILNFDDPVTRGMARESTGKVLFFSRSNAISGDGSYLDQDNIVIRHLGREDEVLPVEAVQLRGTHNLENVLAVCAMAAVCGIDKVDVARVVSEFGGIGHRLELVRVVGGVAYYNDSIATSPQRALAGLRSFDEPVVLIAGGRDKHLPLEELAGEVAERCRGIVLYGEAAELLKDAFAATGVDASCITTVQSFDNTVAAAQRLARPGDVVLLSPACTSFDTFQNFEERGARFRDLVKEIQG